MKNRIIALVQLNTMHINFRLNLHLCMTLKNVNILKDDKHFEERKRTKSLTEPISVYTNMFLPHTSPSPSPTRSSLDQRYICSMNTYILMLLPMPIIQVFLQTVLLAFAKQGLCEGKYILLTKP